MEIQNKLLRHACTWFSKHSWCKPISTISEPLTVKWVLLTYSLQCTGVPESHKLRKTVLLSASSALPPASLPNPLEPEDFQNFQTAVFSNKNITYKKHFKRKTGSQMGIFLLKLTVLRVKTSFQELP